MTGLTKAIAVGVVAFGLNPDSATAEQCFHMGATQFIDGLSYCVSSVLSPQSGNYYGPENLWDGDDRTAWCEGAQGTSGEYLAIRVRGGPAFSRIWFHNGYVKSDKTFTRNARPRTLDIYTDTGLHFQHRLEDHGVDQVLDLPGYAQNEILIRILDVYPGTHYADTCLNGVFIDFEWEEQKLHSN